jgi:hypothetical protein
MMSGGSFKVFIGSPISVTLISVSALLFVGSVVKPLLAARSLKNASLNER